MAVNQVLQGFFTVFSLATQRSWKNADDEWSSKTEWHRVVLHTHPPLANFSLMGAERSAKKIRFHVTYIFLYFALGCLRLFSLTSRKALTYGELAIMGLCGAEIYEQ
jgi:hypothetical protein